MGQGVDRVLGFDQVMLFLVPSQQNAEKFEAIGFLGPGFRFAIVSLSS